MSAKFGSTIGFERQANQTLQADSKDEFVRQMLVGLPPRPANMDRIVAKNQGKLPVAMEAPSPQPCTPEQVVEHLAAGGVVVDTRRSQEFGQGHIPGSYNIQRVSSEFDARVGWIIPPDAPVVLVLDGQEDDARVMQRLVLALVGSGVERVMGYLAGGMAAWQEAGHPLATLDQLAPAEAAKLADTQPDTLILDVSEENEWNQAHIPGARRISFRELERRVGELEEARQHPIAVVCASGQRSSTACSLLKRHGFIRLYNISGGMGAWQKAQLPVEAPASCAMPQVGLQEQAQRRLDPHTADEGLVYYI